MVCFADILGYQNSVSWIKLTCRIEAVAELWSLILLVANFYGSDSPHAGRVEKDVFLEIDRGRISPAKSADLSWAVNFVMLLQGQLGRELEYPSFLAQTENPD